MILSDYGNYYKSVGNYTEHPLKTLEGLQEAIQYANVENMPVRVRGYASSMNGSSLPKRNGMLITTKTCNHLRFGAEGTVTVGAGASIWDLNQLLQEHGYQLLVVNDCAGPAATVGGFVAAGGFGSMSAKNGGFWETVLEISMVTGGGELRKISYTDGLFPWLFGSMGQFGVFFELTLRIQPIAGENPKYPKNVKKRVMASNTDWPRFIWYTLFVPKRFSNEAERSLRTIANKYRTVWLEKPLYNYPIKFKRFNPPLVQPVQEDLVAIGIWGAINPSEPLNSEAFRDIDSEVMDLLKQHPTYRRYVQAELTFDGFPWASYFGHSIYNMFLQLKLQYDPRGILGRWGQPLKKNVVSDPLLELLVR